MLSNRELFIKSIFIPNDKKDGVEYMSEGEVEDIIKKISQVGESLGYVGTNLSKDDLKNNQRKHKYDVWIAKEAKKNISILDRIVDLRLIVDWAIETKIDLFAFTFQEAFESQAFWHLEMISRYEIEKINIPNIDEERIVFRFSDKKHFLYLLNAEELKYEGKVMGHCVGGNNYKQKIKNGLSIILSIRDSKNNPHVTIEIDVPSRMVIQQQGRANQEPIKKYKNFIKEFLLFSTDFGNLDKKEIIKFLNINF
jgi:hypothetical protein